MPAAPCAVSTPSCGSLAAVPSTEPTIRGALPARTGAPTRRYAGSDAVRSLHGAGRGRAGRDRGVPVRPRTDGLALVQPGPDLGPLTPRRDAGLRGGRRVAPRPRPDRHRGARPAARTRAGRRRAPGVTGPPADRDRVRLRRPSRLLHANDERDHDASTRGHGGDRRGLPRTYHARAEPRPPALRARRGRTRPNTGRRVRRHSVALHGARPRPRIELDV